MSIFLVKDCLLFLNLEVGFEGVVEVQGFPKKTPDVKILKDNLPSLSYHQRVD